MNEIMIKEFDGNKVEIIEINGQVLFNPYDVGKCLELAEGTVRDHISKFNSKQVVKLKNSVAGSTNIRKLNNAGENFLTESGVYKLVFKSRKPDAEKFTDWVTDEVLPSILKHGTYMTDEVLANTLDDPDFIISLATKLKEERLAKQKLAQQIEEQAPKVKFANAITGSETSILIRDMAKILNQNGVDTGEKKLFKWLREKEYLISQKGESYNTPSQMSMNLKVMEIKENIVSTPKGDKITKTPVITSKGQQYFIKKFLKMIKAKEELEQVA